MILFSKSEHSIHFNTCCRGSVRALRMRKYRCPLHLLDERAAVLAGGERFSRLQEERVLALVLGTLPSASMCPCFFFYI